MSYTFVVDILMYKIQIGMFGKLYQSEISNINREHRNSKHTCNQF